MTEYHASTTAAPQSDADMLVLPVYEGAKPGPGTRETAKALGLSLTSFLAAERFKGGATDVLVVPTLGRIPAKSVAFIGLGPKKSADANAVRTAAFRAGARSGNAASIASTLPQAAGDAVAAARAFAEGFLLGRYRFDEFKSKPEERPDLSTVTALVTGNRARATEALERGAIHADAANWVRDLVNTPSSDLPPAGLAAVARKIAKQGGLDCTIWDEKRLAREGFGGIVGVGRGGVNPPRMIELSYRGAGSATPIALSGKGITFDSGGLDIKPAKHMEWMKADMAGAAAILAVMRALPLLGLKINVIAAIPSAENMPGGNAIRPGDVLHMHGGTTVEVTDTDAEGRLVLADALAYLSAKKPRAVIDTATLTGTGLGEDVWAIMGTDQTLVDQLRAAGDEAGEPGWQFPLVEAYTRHTDSDVADIKNADWSGADTLASGLFLRAFAGKTPWAHLDVGDTAFLEEDRDAWPEGPTGCPTRVILRYLEGRAGERFVAAR